jgi:hypothetical protein
MFNLCLNVLLELGTSVPLQAFSRLTLQSRRVFTNLNMRTTLSSPKESPAWPPQHPLTWVKISDQLQSLHRAVALRALPTGPPNTGSALNPLTHHDIARRRQGINNYTCRTSGVWLKSNLVQ